ncbi:hypothetical protein AGABI1DRAFT_83341, partial [Agaricus bisporus var. burnettii JB137-S8]
MPANTGSTTRNLVGACDRRHFYRRTSGLNSSHSYSLKFAYKFDHADSSRFITCFVQG